MAYYTPGATAPNTAASPTGMPTAISQAQASSGSGCDCKNPTYQGAGPGGGWNNPVPCSVLWCAYAAAAGAQQLQQQQQQQQTQSITSTTTTGNVQPAPLPSNPVLTPNTQVGNPDNPAGLSFAQVENYWIQAGGSPQAAAMAAAVADAESGLNAQAQRTNPDGTTGVGLWLIPSNGTPPGSTDPLANARAAVQLSQNGTDWTQWCSTWSDNNCGQNNGTYLGQGANALMSLGGQEPGASYNVFGATPASNGVGASSATSGIPGTTSTTTGSSNYLMYAIIVVIVVVIIYLAMRKTQSESTQ